MPAFPGWEDLPYDIFPRQRYIFSADIAPPIGPSDYILEVGLATAAMRWFSEQGTDPLKIAIRVVSTVNSDFESALAQQVKVIDDPPQVAITLDRPRYWLGGQVRVMVNLANAARGYTVDAYFAVVWPDGRDSFQDHSGLVMELEGIWKPLVKNFALTQGDLIQQPLLDLKLPQPLLQEGNMPSGCYPCYLILTEPDTYQIIATAWALFWLEPL